MLVKTQNGTVEITKTVDERIGNGYVYGCPNPEDIEFFDMTSGSIYTDIENNRQWGYGRLEGTILHCTAP